MTQVEIKYDDGPAYERAMGAWSQLAGEDFLGWLAPAPGLSWVDIGCGTGSFTKLIVQRCAPSEAQALDPAEAQLVYARQRAELSNVTFHQGDAMALPFEDGQFDAAVMALVIFFVPDPGKSVAEMARVVRQGGLVSTYAWDMLGGGFPYEPIQAEMRAVGMTPPWPPNADASRMAALVSLWEAAGLEAVQTREINVQRSFPNFKDFWTASTGSGALRPTISAMAPDDLALLQARVQVRLGVDADGPVNYEARANAIQGHVPEVL
jgi:SAM-dependent methyltransferase